MYLFDRVVFRLYGVKNRLLERGFSYRDQLPWDVLQAVDAVACVRARADGGHLARQKMEALQFELRLHPDLFGEMSVILQCFHQAVLRRSRATAVHPDDVTDIFLQPGGLLNYITNHH